MEAVKSVVNHGIRELSVGEASAVSGGFGLEDFVLGAGSTWAGALGSTATVGSGIFASTAGAVGGALGGTAFLGGWWLGSEIYDSFDTQILDGIDAVANWW